MTTNKSTDEISKIVEKYRGAQSFRCMADALNLGLPVRRTAASLHQWAHGVYPPEREYLLNLLHYTTETDWRAQMARELLAELDGVGVVEVVRSSDQA